MLAHVPLKLKLQFVEQPPPSLLPQTRAKNKMSTTESETTREISCVSLGMVILDEIRMPNKPPMLDVIGGSATFVTLGLRLFATKSFRPGCLVMAGSDFPQDIKDEMTSWRTSLVVKDLLDLRSSRGLLTYQDSTFGPKTFEYTTSPIRPTPRDLVGMPLLRARAFHFFGTPQEVMEQIPSLHDLRQKHHPDLPKPCIVWEPLPSSCVPENLDKFKEACKLVDVFSPNHLELAALFSSDQPLHPSTSLLARLEALGQHFLAAGISPSNTGTLIIRAGADGALALQVDRPAVHVPAFYPHGSGKVVDPTGAGNAFLGGYVAGWLREGHVRQALHYGAVAASFALEQIGLPRSEDVSAEAGMERLDEFRGRLKI